MLSRISASSVRPLGAHPVREFLAFQDEGAAIRSSIRSTGPNTNVVMRAREAPKLAQANAQSKTCWSECSEHNQA